MATTEWDTRRLDEAKAALRQRVDDMIEQVDDWQILERLANGLDEIVSQNKIYTLTPEVKAALERSRKDYAEGRWTDHEEFMMELDQWFNENE